MTDDLKNQNRFNKLLDFLDHKLQEDNISDSWEKFNDFDIAKSPLNQLVTFFDQKYNKTLQNKMLLPSSILALKLVKQAKLTNEEYLLVLTGMNLNNQDQLYEQTQKPSKKFKQGQVNPGSNNSETFLSHEEALAAAGYIPHSKFNKSTIK